MRGNLPVRRTRQIPLVTKRTSYGMATRERIPMTFSARRATMRGMNNLIEHSDGHAVVVALTTEHLRAIEAALDLARAVEHGQIRVSDPDELGQASVAAEGLSDIARLTTSGA